MQNTLDIENVSMNRQFSVFTLYSFTKNNTEIPCILVALKLQKRWQNRKR